MQINFVAILIATVVQFIIGAVWYSALFGKLWGKIHGFDKLPKATQQKMMKAMGPFYVLQFVVTLVTTFVLEIFIVYLPHDWNVYGLAGFFWVGFVVPTQVSAVIFGGTESKWIVKKIAVQAGAAFFCLEAAAVVLSFFTH
jgi:hypothetical protein